MYVCIKTHIQNKERQKQTNHNDNKQRAAKDPARVCRTGTVPDMVRLSCLRDVYLNTCYLTC